VTKARVGDSVGPYRVSEIRKADLVQIKALWENLNQLHLKDSRFFKDHYQNFIFEERIESWKDLPDEDFKVVVVSKEAQLLGYCVASLRGRVGEIESVYLEEPIRNSGIGGEIVRLCLDWLHQKQAKKIVVSVADGHESVIPFYQKLGFQPRLTYLELKE
jgi:RimJ/RimL family protein N-acetyltransferase